MRAHYTRPVTDGQGDILPNVQVSIYEPGTETLIPDVIYSTDLGNNVLFNPYVSNTGVVDFYLDQPRRVRLGLIQGNLPVQYYEDVDVLAAGSDSQHFGAGAQSLVIGEAASAPGDQSTALGTGSSSGGNQAAALGAGANALGGQSVAIGSASVQGVGAVGVGNAAGASGDGAVALGQAASAGAANAVALGQGASAPFVQSVAIGAGAITTGPNQILMGTAAEVTEIPPGSALVLSSPDGTRYRVTVDDSGSLVTTVS